MAYHPQRFLEHYSDFSLDTHTFHIYHCSPGAISRATERFSEDNEQVVESRFARVKKLIGDLEGVIQQDGFSYTDEIQEFDKVAKQDETPTGYELIIGRDYKNDSNTVHLFFRGIITPNHGRQLPDVLDRIAFVHSKEYENDLAERLEPLMTEYGLERKTEEDKEEVEPEKKEYWLIKKLKDFREKRKERKRSQARRDFYQEASSFIVHGSEHHNSFIASSEDYKATLTHLRRNYETKLTREDMIDIADRVILDGLNNSERNAFLNGALRICKIDKPPVEVRYSDRYKLLIKELTSETVTP